MKTEYEYIHFELIGTKPKTTIWNCANNKSGESLGMVKWHSAWRQYCYFPKTQAVYSAGCLEDINNFLKGVNNGHKDRT